MTASDAALTAMVDKCAVSGDSDTLMAVERVKGRAFFDTGEYLNESVI